MPKLKVYSTNYIKRFSLFHYAFYHPLAKFMMARCKFLLSENDIDPKKHYIFVANHSGAPDFFVVFFGLPFKITRLLVPYRFFIANRFFKKRSARWVLMSFGGFPAKKHRTLDWGVPAGERAMKRNETVVIFPEGKVAPIDRKYPPKRGIEFLAKNPNAMLIPVRVKWHRNKGLVKSYDLTVGKPFDAHNMTAAQIMDRVYDLEL